MIELILYSTPNLQTSKKLHFPFIIKHWIIFPLLKNTQKHQQKEIFLQFFSIFNF
jgi:hypothetical protein